MPDATDIPTLRRLWHDNRRIAVVGISAEWHRPSFFVGKYLLEHGYTMIPVNPKYPELLGQRCYADLPSAARDAGPIDMVDCFRKAEDIGAPPTRRSRSVQRRFGCNSGSSIKRQQRRHPRRDSTW